MLFKSTRFRARFVTVLAVLSALIFFGFAPAHAADSNNASISGTVTVPDGVDLTSISVSAQAADQWYSVQLEADGRYTFTDLPAGSFKIQFSGYRSGAVSQWYGGASSYEAATPVTVAAGQAVTGIDVTLAKGASISGRITAPTGVDLASVGVSVQTANDYFWGQLDADGTYTVSDLPAGSFRVAFLANNSGAVTQWYGGASSFEAATQIPVVTGQAVTGIDAALVKGATISGKITAPPGVDLTSLSVSAWQPSRSYASEGQVGDDGNFKISGLSAGAYKIKFEGRRSGALEQWYTGASTFEDAKALTVTTGQDLAGINATMVKAASISGKIMAPADVDPSTIQVTARDAASSFGSSYFGYTNEVGEYAVTGLPAGSYKIEFSSYQSNVLTQWYKNATSFESGTAVALTSGQDVAGVDATLAKAATISGKVTAPAGVDLRAINVAIHAADGSTLKYAQVDADGNYLAVGLATGRYKVEFTTDNTGALGQWYGGASSFESATEVAVTAGQDVTGINAQLVKGASIAGKVTAPAGVDVGLVYVDVTSASNTRFGSRSIRVNPDGNYKVQGLPEGSYRIGFRPDDSGALPLWYPNAASATAATAVSVGTGQDVANINATLVKGASVSGKVTVPAGFSAGGLTVSLTRTDNPRAYSSYVFVEADGSYKIVGLSAGDFRLEFLDTASGLLDPNGRDGTTVTLAAGQDLSGVNTTMTKGATIGGRVSVPAGADAASVSVSAVRDDGAVFGIGSQLGLDGSYKVKGLAAGTYKVSFAGGDSGALSEWYDNAPTADKAAPITLAAGQDRAGVDATLALGGSISGKVNILPGFNPMDGYYSAEIYRAEDSTQWVGYASVGTDGRFKLRGLAAGSYKVLFSSYNTGALDRWYGGADTFAGAATITVAAGQAVAVADTTLIKGATISGKITAPAALDLRQGRVVAYPNGTVDAGRFSSSVGPDGNYKLTALPAGSYKLKFEGGTSGATDLWYGGTSLETATPVIVTTSQDRTGTNMTAITGASLSGKVSGLSSYGYPVDIVDAAGKTVKNGYTDAAGTFSVVGLAAGSYKVAFNRSSGYAQEEAQFYNNKPESAGPAQAQAITVTPGQSVQDINAGLVQGGSITGTATDKAGKPLVNARVQAYTVNGSLITREGSTDNAGKYTIPGLTTGKYIVVLHNSPLGNLYSGNATTEGSAVQVSVATGKATSLDLAYAPATAPLTAPVPVIAGTAKVGSTLTAAPGTWAPAPVALAYQWKANGAAITGATASTYKPAAADLGKTITVTVTGSKAGYTTAEKTSAATAPVVAADQVLTAPAPAITGTAKVGSTLTAVPGIWAPSPVTLAYQWKANGAAISGATASTYKLAAADLGKAITVTVTGSKAGYTTAEKTSAATAPVVAADQILTAPAPAITGTAKVGSTLTAVPGIWAPSPVTLAYQWKANGAAITGSTASTYKLAAADLGKAITVTVTGSKTGYTTAAKTSAATASVGAGALATAVPAISGTAKVGATLTALARTWGPAPVTLRYQWRANGAAITGATASTYKLGAAYLGKAISVTVTGSKAGYNTAAKTSAATAKVGAGVLATAVPTISGTARVGYALTALPRTWGPAPVTLRYQWRANGVAIKGATASKFKPSASLRGKALTVTVTGSKAGYTTVAKTSIATARLR